VFDLKPTADVKPELYRDLLAALDALTAGEPDAVANMANAAALLWDWLPDLNWAGFYRLVDGDLVLGPFQGKPACIRIPARPGRVRDRGGVARNAGRARRPCLSGPHRLRRGEPVGAGGADRRGRPLLGVLDLDSPIPARFDAADAAGCEAVAALLATRLN
jgi:GAF domain-containing protein